MIIVTDSAKRRTYFSTKPYAKVFTREQLGATLITNLSIAYFRALLGALAVFTLISARLLTLLTWHRA